MPKCFTECQLFKSLCRLESAVCALLETIGSDAEELADERYRITLEEHQCLWERLYREALEHPDHFPPDSLKRFVRLMDAKTEKHTRRVTCARYTGGAAIRQPGTGGSAEIDADQTEDEDRLDKLQEEIPRFEERLEAVRATAARTTDAEAAATPGVVKPDAKVYVARPADLSGSTTAAPNGESGMDVAPHQGGVQKLRGLKPAEQKAYQSYEFAESKMPVAPKTDRDAYDWLIDNPGQFEGYDLPAFETWQRQVREGRRFHGTQKNRLRHLRPTGRNIVNGREI